MANRNDSKAWKAPETIESLTAEIRSLNNENLQLRRQNEQLEAVIAELRDGLQEVQDPTYRARMNMASGPTTR